MNEFDIPNAHNARFGSSTDKIKEIIKMDQVIQDKDVLLAALYSIKDLSQAGKTEWFGKPHFPLQGSRMHYNKGMTFKTHKHLLNPRVINFTQEAFIVISGKIQVDLYKKKDGILGEEIIQLGSLVASAGDVIFVWGEYHKISILEDNTVAYEIKAGQFTSVEQDKTFLDV